MNTTPAQIERLVKLNEECSEVQQLISKAILNGFENYHPDDETKTTNRELLEKEIGHVLYAIGLCLENNDIDANAIQKHITKKDKTITKWLLYNRHTEGVVDKIKHMLHTL
jgi:hypothetical protein